MSRIEVGMLVRINDKVMEGTDAKGFRPSLIGGSIGIVLSNAFIAISEGKQFPCWNIEGIKEVCAEEILIPINPDAEPAEQDFQEDLKRWLGEKVTA